MVEGRESWDVLFKVGNEGEDELGLSWIVLYGMEICNCSLSRPPKGTSPPSSACGSR